MRVLSLTPLALVGFVGTAAAKPLLFNETAICASESCVKPEMKYEKIAKAQPGIQWMDSGGYCGSWAVQRATLAKGAYISQGQVRSHTDPGGGHNEEILSDNIDEAYRNLKIKVEAFDFNRQPLPQQPAYFKWLKRQLVAGHVVTWMIMWNGQSYPIYNLTAPAGMYGHVEPVIGIQSNHPLTDEKVYDDDVAVHFNDDGIKTIYKVISTLPCTWAGPGKPGLCGSSDYGIGPYSFGWAVQGFLDNYEEYQQASLSIDPWMMEPNTSEGDKPIPITGTLTVEGLTVGSSYEIYRWDTTKDAFIYADEYKKSSFKATSATHVYKDPKTFMSDSTTYYRCVPALAK
jgi:hypothetical protein